MNKPQEYMNLLAIVIIGFFLIVLGGTVCASNPMFALFLILSGVGLMLQIPLAFYCTIAYAIFQLINIFMTLLLLLHFRNALTLERIFGSIIGILISSAIIFYLIRPSIKQRFFKSREKASIGIIVIGWVLIISNVIYLSPIFYDCQFMKSTVDILTSRYILPPSLSFNLIPIKLLNIFPPPSLIVTLIISVFFLFIGACLLRLVNLARLVVVIMSSVLILEQVLRLVMGNPNREILGWVILFLTVIVHTAYIYYLTRPDVKKRFK